MHFSLIASVASALIVLVAVVAKVPTYRVAPIFLIPLLWAPYFLRRRLHLHPFHFALFAVALLIHCLGAFGFYQRGFFGLSFDIYLHFYFAFAAAFVLERFFRGAMPARMWAARALTLMVMMGFGALHEIMEYASYLLLGEERGMLKPSTSYAFDTQRDLLNNLFGTLTALMFITIAERFMSARQQQPREAAIDDSPARAAEGGP